MPQGQQGGAFLPKQPQANLYPVTTIAGDALVPVVPGIYWLTKGSAAAVTLAPPTSGDVGTELVFIAGTAFAHVVTCTAKIDNGVTGGAKDKWTSAAFVGSSVTLCAMPNLKWSVIAMNLGAAT